MMEQKPASLAIDSTNAQAKTRLVLLPLGRGKQGGRMRMHRSPLMAARWFHEIAPYHIDRI
jgi:hypothetical protein